MVARMRMFFGELRREFKRINWPSRNEALRLSVVVIVVSLIVAAFLGALDFVFGELLRALIS